MPAFIQRDEKKENHFTSVNKKYFMYPVRFQTWARTEEW